MCLLNHMGSVTEWAESAPVVVFVEQAVMPMFILFVSLLVPAMWF